MYLRSLKRSQGTGNQGRILFSSNPSQVNKSSTKPDSIGCYDPHIYRDAQWESSCAKGRLHDGSVTSTLKALTMNGKTTPSVDMNASLTPSQIPLRAPTHSARAKISSPSKSPEKALSLGRFLTRDSNTPVAWNTEDRFERMEHRFSELKEIIGGATSEDATLKEIIAIYKTKGRRMNISCNEVRLIYQLVNELELMRMHLTENNDALQKELDDIKSNLRTSATALEDSKRYHSNEIDDLRREHRRELEETCRRLEEEARRIQRERVDAIDEMNRLQRRLEHALEDEAHHRRAEMESLGRENEINKQKAESELNEQRKAVRGLEDDLASAREETSREKALNNDLRVKLSEAGSQSISLEVSMRSLRAQIEFLESDNKSQSNAFVDLETRLQNALRATAEANEKLRKEETLRRKLHNQVQELKGNIRVFCRVRPALGSDSAQEVARISYPDTEADSKEVEVLGPDEKSSLGNITNKKNTFSFDRVFRPSSANAEIFNEISQLVQSALDGYNVCIFCYGQTGSGKTYTMSAEDGMIPRAVRQIYDTAKSLEDKGWKYSMEGSFIEVYNENLNDLLGKADDFDKKKHEIRHDMQNCKTTITDITTVDLDTPNKVETILHQASANRSVAATKANERSSRSHSVFILKLVGKNATTGEKSEGTLNLVDLAGSERLSHSKATGDRLKETQNINKSLSCLGDVIGALGQGKEGGHVPYRNSKVYRSLQSSGFLFCTPRMLTESPVNISATIFARGKLKNPHVRNDQSISVTSQRNFDKSQVCHQGEDNVGRTLVRA